jgi:hypothetical protein
MPSTVVGSARAGGCARQRLDTWLQPGSRHNAVAPDRAMASSVLAACHCSDDQVRFGSGDDGAGKAGVRLFMRQVFLAGEEPDEGTALFRGLVADRAAASGSWLRARRPQSAG